MCDGANRSTTLARTSPIMENTEGGFMILVASPSESNWVKLRPELQPRSPERLTRLDSSRLRSHVLSVRQGASHKSFFAASSEANGICT